VIGNVDFQNLSIFIRRKCGSQSAKGKTMNIYVGNMPFSMTENQLNDAFSAFGTVTSARIATDRDTGRAKGFGFVEMGNNAEAAKAITALNGTEHDGRNIVVNEAKPREERSSSSSSRGGFGGNGGGRSGGNRW